MTSPTDIDPSRAPKVDSNCLFTQTLQCIPRDTGERRDVGSMTPAGLNPSSGARALTTPILGAHRASCLYLMPASHFIERYRDETAVTEAASVVWGTSVEVTMPTLLLLGHAPVTSESSVNTDSNIMHEARYVSFRSEPRYACPECWRASGSCPNQAFK